MISAFLLILVSIILILVSWYGIQKRGASKRWDVIWVIIPSIVIGMQITRLMVFY